MANVACRMPTRIFEAYNIGAERELHQRKTLCRLAFLLQLSAAELAQKRLLHSSFSGQSVTRSCTPELFFPFRIATRRHRLGQPCAVSRIFVLARANHICQKQHTFNSVSCTFLLGSSCRGAANRLPHSSLRIVCFRTQPVDKCFLTAGA